MTELSVEDTYNILSMLAIGDSAHDFGDIKINTPAGQQSFKTTFAGTTPDKFSTVYCEGLPDPRDTCFRPIRVGGELEEDNVFKLLLKNKGGVPITDAFDITPSISSTMRENKGTPEYFNTIQQTINGGYSSYALQTKNNITYQVLGKVVATSGRGDDKVFINGIDLLTSLGIVSEGEPNKKIAIVIDAAAVAFLEILKTGPEVGAGGPIIYYTFTPEVENDPATKQSPIDPKLHKTLFNKTVESGVKLIPLIQKFSTSSSDDVKYYFNDSSIGRLIAGDYKNILPYESFYTNYNFILSGLKQKKSGSSSKIYTSLNVNYDTKERTITKSVENSKTNNEINFLMSTIVNNIKRILSKLTAITTASREDFTRSDNQQTIFDINASFQQKRSGDWLQALVCKTLFSRQLRQVNLVGKNVQIDDNPLSTNPIDPFTDVYFVTHDRIALAFALLNGVNCIYTHGATTACYSFKIADPTFLLQQKQNNIRNILRLNTEEGYNSVYSEERVLIVKINGSAEITTVETRSTPSTQVPGYNKRYTDKQEQYLRELRGLTNSLVRLFFTNDTMDEMKGQSVESRIATGLTGFTGICRELFKKMFEYSQFYSTYPELRPTLIEYERTKQNIKELISVAMTEFNEYLRNTDPTRPEPENVSKLLNFYTKLNELYSKLKKVNTFVDIVGTTLNVDDMNIVNTLQKSAEYKSINLWNWDIKETRRNRLVDVFELLRNTGKSGGEQTTFKQDSNSFLYMIYNLPNEISINVTTIFIKLYEDIRDRPSIFKQRFDIADRDEDKKIKLRAFIKNLCVEIFMTIGGLTQREIIDEAGGATAVPITELDVSEFIQNYMKTNMLVGAAASEGIKLTDSYVVSSSIYYNVSLDNLTHVSSKLNTILTVDAITSTDTGRIPTDVDSDTRIDSIIDAKLFENVPISFGGNKKTKKYGVRKSKNNKNKNKTQKNKQSGGAKGRKPVIPLFDYNNQSIFRTILTNILQTRYINDYNSYIVNILQQQRRPTMLSSLNPIELEEYNEMIRRIYSINISDELLNMVYEKIKRREFRDYNDMYEFIVRPFIRQGGGNSENEGKKEINIAIKKTIPNILKMNFCFHPLLPIFMMCDAAYSFSCNNNVEESLDYELFKNYVDFLKRLKSIVESKCKTDDLRSQIEAYFIGLGLKELLFNAELSDIIIGDDNNIFGIKNNSLLNQVYQMRNILAYSIVGENIDYNEGDGLISDVLLKNSIFQEFMSMVNPKDIFEKTSQETVEGVSELSENIFTMMNEISKKMNEDKNYEEISEEILEKTIEKPVSEPIDKEKEETSKDIEITEITDTDINNYLNQILNTPEIQAVGKMDNKRDMFDYYSPSSSTPSSGAAAGGGISKIKTAHKISKRSKNKTRQNK